MRYGTHAHRETHRIFLKSKCTKPYKRRTKDQGNMEQIDEGHGQHKHDEETDIQCHCSAEETKTKVTICQTVCHVSSAGRQTKR